MKKIYTIILILLTAIAAHAQTFYVAPGGAAILSMNVNAPGSIDFAFTNAPKHATVYVKAGNYTGSNLTVGNDSTTFIMINCLVYDFDRLESRYQEHSTSAGVVNFHGIIPSNYTYDHCNFYNNGFNAQVIANGTIPPVSTTPIVPATNNTFGGIFINCNTLDPGFINPSANDYRLSNCATCGTIDKGRSQIGMNNMGYGFITSDLDGNTRPSNDTFDIGTYEFQSDGTPTTSINNPITESNDGFKIYPNPVGNLLNIDGVLSPDFEIVIYTVSGVEVSRHRNQRNIDISDLTDGIYFLTLKTENRQFTKKIVKN